MHSKHFLKSKAIIIVVFLLVSLLGFSQNDTITNVKGDKIEEPKEWKFTAAPYLLLPSMKGDVAVKGIPVDVNVTPGDILDNLDFGMMLYFEATKEKWSFSFDLLYMDLGKKGSTPLVSRKASVDIKQIGVTVNGLYRINNWFEVGIGSRLNSVKTGVKITEGDYVLPGTNFSMTQTWFDPLVVTRIMTDLNENLRLGLLADIGGFGIGSDLAWQINPFVGYQISECFEVAIAYRWLDMDYNNGSGTDYFLYDLNISGAEIGFIFHF